MKTISIKSHSFKFLVALWAIVFAGTAQQAYAQDKQAKPPISKRESARRSMHSRDSLLRALNKTDTSINSLLQRVEQYTTTFNQINNNLSEGLDTADISQQLPSVVRRLNRMDSLAKTHKSSTLRYLFVLRDNLDRTQGKLEDWQSQLGDIDSGLVHNQKDLIRFFKDTTLRAAPTDSTLRRTYFNQLQSVRHLWRKTDSLNRTALLKVNLLQNEIAVAYNRILDQTDQIDLKIKRFAIKAISGESDYIWNTGLAYNDFKAALSSTIKLNRILLNYFNRNEKLTNLVGVVFLILVFIWVFYNRIKTFKNNDNPVAIFERAGYIYKDPIISSLLIGTAIIPYFYTHPPVVCLEAMFLISIIVSLLLTRKEHPKTYYFLFQLFWITIVYGASNLFIQISNIDRYTVLILSIVSIIIGYLFLKKCQKDPEGHLPNTCLVLKVFIGLQLLSLLLNISGRFSLAKIIGVTAVFNLWLLVIFYLVVQIILQGLYLQFQTKKDANSIINWIDFTLVEKKFKSILVTVAALLWGFTLLQNLNVDDWANDNVHDLLSESRTVGGASFTFRGFLIFIAVIWLSSVISRIISYFYDVSAQRVTDLSVLKKKNRTSALLIRLGVFSAGFLLAVAASGFPLEKLTIIISAFGIGIGFGLQNIVNNLVSGLILAFEKPIQIGDIIEVGNRSGTMKEIGVRSSKLLTSDGSEVIIPNGDLISQHVVNWTLSNSNRRIELMIATAYGADINHTKDLLKNMLSNREDIMTSPAPSVFLSGVSETSVDFKIFFWAADITTTNALKSTVLADIYDMLPRENVAIPSARKDLYLHFPEGMPVVGGDEKGEAK
ncbi:mechanosensitive ion channel family protein [Mucilaginibacter boryungensis]|uniref:Mechanosensitive ion channel n=1 Tax=Mucilaginibacter boryungensis TaxID=768480 RepID=A0ABR9XH76_9SPHI|nr:mechanosensitive ion channel domain-containing protein [Mucilaginibacter boryungensis]MBE9666555.1 mechanosensitive ion channel [Mucilaginibacter boryungensis]